MICLQVISPLQPTSRMGVSSGIARGQTPPLLPPPLGTKPPKSGNKKRENGRPSPPSNLPNLLLLSLSPQQEQMTRGEYFQKEMITTCSGNSDRRHMAVGLENGEIAIYSCPPDDDLTNWTLTTSIGSR